MSLLNIYRVCFLVAVLSHHVVAPTTPTTATTTPPLTTAATRPPPPTTTPTTTTTTLFPVLEDFRCSPPAITVKLSDDEVSGCQYNKHELNLTCVNKGGYREQMGFSIDPYGDIFRLYSAFGFQPAVCVSWNQARHTVGEFYETTLNVTSRRGDWSDAIGLRFEVVEMNDPPRINFPADIYVKEKDTETMAWNITWSDPDGFNSSSGRYSIISDDIPEQLIIKETTINRGNFTTQHFNLVRVAAFDADMLYGSGGPQWDEGRWEPDNEFRAILFMNEFSSGENQFLPMRETPLTFIEGICNTGKQTGSHKCCFPFVKMAVKILISNERLKRDVEHSKNTLTRFPRGRTGPFVSDDYPGPRTNFTLTISDETGQSSSFTVNVHISDINDNEPVCKTPETIAIARDADQLQSLFNMRTICYDPDYNFRNQISDYRFSNMRGCMGAFGIYSHGSLYLKTAFPKNMSSCDFDVIVMDPAYATSVHLKLTYGECAASLDARGVLWNASSPGTFQYMPCPQGYTGRVSRYCNNYAIFEPAVYLCTDQIIRDISHKIRDIYNGVRTKNISLTGVLKELKTATDKEMLVGDIETVSGSLRTINNIVRDQYVDDADKTEAFIDVADNLLRENNSETWASMIYQEGKGAENVIDAIDDFVSAIVTVDPDSVRTPQNFMKENILLSMGSTSGCSENMNFPDKSMPSLPDWIRHSDNRVYLQCSAAGKNKHFSSTFYKNISGMIPPRTLNSSLVNDTINSAVISFSLFPEERKKLDQPVEVTFNIINKTMKDPKCSYWQTDLYRGVGSWATDGCELKSYENGIVTCLCDHLTNFAILMSPADPEEIEEYHVTALSIISLIGCIMSMICLLVTILAYIIYWKDIKSERSVILMNLCITLFIAYLIFLVGVNKTEDKAGCAAVAVILHYVYLVVFLLMLVQGINLALTVLKPLKKQRFGWQMILAAYGTSMVIVAISMGATQLEGYGTEKFCWLSVDSGLLWAFLAPVLVVIIVNTVIAGIVIHAMFGTAAVKKKTEREKLRTGIRSLCVLMPVMGTTWIFGIFSVNRETIAFQYLFAIFNSIQGVLIFVFHCVLNTKMQDAVKKSKAGQIFTSETVSSDGEKIPMKSVDTTNTSVK